MRAELITDFKKCRIRGGSLLEILIALALLSLSLSASALLVFANQSLKADSITQNEALNKIGKVLEEARAISRFDFTQLLTLGTSTDDIYQKSLFVRDKTPCLKEATGYISWSTEALRPQKIKLRTALGNMPEAFALGGDCDSEISGDWDNPSTYGAIDLAPSGIQGNDVKASRRGTDRFAFIASSASSPAKPDFWIINATDAQNPSISSSVETGPGLNAIDVAYDNASGKYFAYAANDDLIDQLQIIDTTDTANPVLVAAMTLPGVTGSCPSTCPGGRSIYYYDKKVYVGTHRLVGGAKHELHIYDVSNPLSPNWLGSKKIDHNVNAIIVRDNWAYLATSDNDGEVIILNVSDPTNIPDPTSGPGDGTKFDAADTPSNIGEDGTALYLLGGKLYLGRERAPSSRPDFYVLDIADPESVPALGSKNLGINPNTEITGIVVSAERAFIATTDSTGGFQVWNIADPSNIILQSSCSIYNYSEKATGIDFVDNLGFISNESNKALRIIYDQPSICI
ncbi:hypothetical protein HYW53_02290 [Candidatus Giovannonibacteria bacterium]|nr:hypothetical protein [Candidatus Giovannonibacteria bacterium]